MIRRELGKELSTKELCDALSVPRSSYYRKTNPGLKPEKREKKPHPRALSQDEQVQVLKELNSERFCDMSPGEIYTILLDEGRYLCSERTMYRLLEKTGALQERRQKSRVIYQCPELLCTAPNQLWSWDITKLKGPQKWTYYYLYKIMDVYSRAVVGWMVAHVESAELAKALISQTLIKQNIPEGQLTLHADRGSSMKSNLVAQLLADMGVTKSHSRPYVSNDNPFSEAAFKTLKYRPEFPEKFGSIEDARQYCKDFFDWYNLRHRHSGIAMMTPDDVHFGREKEVWKKRQDTLDGISSALKNRFVKGKPKAKLPDSKVWINKPKTKSDCIQNVA